MFTIENSGEMTDTHNFFLPAIKTVSTVLYFLIPVLCIHSLKKYQACAMPERGGHSLSPQRMCI